MCALDYAQIAHLYDAYVKTEFDRIIIPFNAFAELVRPEDQRQALARVREHLAQDGCFVCTLHNPTIRLRDVDGRLQPRGEHPLPDGGVLFLSKIERYDEARHLVTGTRLYQVVDAQGVIQSDLSLDVGFYLHDRRGFEALFRSAGFASAALYGDYARSAYEPQQSPFMIWILKKTAPAAF